ncbi:MAG: hypothetical protein IJM20_00690 [Clostridia bacterium]|nr:hypothetical protein [Clostridia bacterium]
MNNNDIEKLLDGANESEAETLLCGIDTEDMDVEGVSGERVRSSVFEKCGIVPRRQTQLPQPERAFGRKTRRFDWKRVIAAAAAVLLLVGAGLGAYALVKENREYKTALAFFEEHGLPTEGLTRKEIRDVYRDISSNSFTDPMSEKVLTAYANNLRLSEDMIYVGTNVKTNSDYLWRLSNNIVFEPYPVHLIAGASLLYDGNVHFEREWTGLEYEGHATGFNEKCTFEKYVGGELIWSVDFPLESVEVYAPVSDGVLAAGVTDIINAENAYVQVESHDKLDEAERLREKFIEEELPKYADHAVQRRFIAKINDKGEVVFKKYFDITAPKYNSADYYDYIEFESILLETPEGYALLEPGGHNYRAFVLTSFSRDGDFIGSVSPSIGECGEMYLECAAPGESGIIALLRPDYYIYNSLTPDPATFSVVRIGLDGIVTEIGTFTPPYPHFCISSIAEHDGKIWISGYRWQAAKDSSGAGGRGELANVISDIFADMDRWSSDEGFFVPSDYLTPRVREVYEAKLFLLDEGGTVSELCSVPGALGSILSVGADGSLVWNVDSIESTYFSPATNSFTIGGACRVERYRFFSPDVSPAVEQTGALVQFRR